MGAPATCTATPPPEYRTATKLPGTTTPVSVATARPAAGRVQGSLGFVNEAMNWLATQAGTAGTGTPAPKVVRTER